MEITVKLSEFDVELLEAYRVLYNYEHELDLERFINTKDENGNRYELDLKMLLCNLSDAVRKAKKET